MVNPDAPEWSNPEDSEAFLNGEITEFPHAYANRVTRNEGCFYARMQSMDIQIRTATGIIHITAGAELFIRTWFFRFISAGRLRLTSSFSASGAILVWMTKAVNTI